ncbi:hypothetical protein RIF29_32123 [Crotalaria pallida]|uniref:Uncharacterized protein n=1 Tax=Crotalaria pallida TaxID=3830 RepID=A0AAN9EKA7_CROPI
MAHISKSTTMFFVMVFVVGLLFVAEVRAQDGEFNQAPAPAPAKDTGAGSLVTYSGAFVCSSLLLSLLSFLHH